MAVGRARCIYVWPLHSGYHDLALCHLTILGRERRLEHVQAVDGAGERVGGRIEGVPHVQGGHIEGDNLVQPNPRALAQVRLEGDGAVTMGLSGLNI
ncbi:hypothetical protein MAR_009910 [Mya arenaria]|uniref:Uncharacterized protein n=1 Tax=Mya arenaria TaxID=6604 RepID=A0ABY7E030_MYAAR|nr:hypothetical protein MAR_009910 [Mya arenaria]